MGSPLPALDRDEFLGRLSRLRAEELSPASQEVLWTHFQELRRWNPKISLIGPGTAQEAVERHYGEALTGLDLLPPGAHVVLDVGSGAGFPGFVLAACRTDLSVTLVESNARKWAFLEAVCRRAALPCPCLNVRVEIPLPEGLPPTMDVLTARALKVDAIVAALDQRLSAGARLLLWVGGDAFSPPRGWRLAHEKALVGSTQRRIVALSRA